MKKIYALLLVAAGTVLSAAAQPFQKGDKLIGGSLGYGVRRSTYNYPQSPTPNPNQNYDYRYYSFNIAPSIGFFTSPKRLTGFSLLFDYGSSTPATPDYQQKTYTYGLGFYKQYWNSLGKNFYFNIQGRVGANYGKAENIYPLQTDKIENGTAYLSIDPGFAYRMKKRLVLDVYYTSFLSAGFTYSERKGLNGLYSRDYIVNASTGLQSFSLYNVVFGFRYLL